MVTVHLKARGKWTAPLPPSLSIDASSPVSEVVKQISATSKTSSSRIRLSLPSVDGKPAPGSKDKSVVLDAKKPLSTYTGNDTELTVHVKDLGPQLAWRTVFILEYLGPLLIHPFFFFAQKLIYGYEFDHTQDQALVFGFVVLHFLKREFETVAVHKFSLETMPFANLFVNSFHYWIMSGILPAYFVYAPSGYKPIASLPWLFARQEIVPLGVWGTIILSGLYIFSELANFNTHVALSNLRPAGSTERAIPYGFGFDLVSCPNYFFESLAWLAIVGLTQNWTFAAFWIEATGQMWVWAVKKHARYRREFPNYPKNRRIMFPFIA